jgi:hypothetical protein
VLIVVSHATVLTVPYAAIYASACGVLGVFLRVCYDTIRYINLLTRTKVRAEALNQRRGGDQHGRMKLRKS